LSLEISVCYFYLLLSTFNDVLAISIF